MKEGKHKKESVFELNGGMPPLGQALPLAFQHIVAMIVGCVTPAIIIAGVAGLSGEDKVIIVQAALVVSALATLLQVFPVGFRKGSLQFGAGLPLIVGVGFAYVTSMSTIVEGYGIATIFGAEIVGGIVAVLVGLSYNKIKSLFPPLIIGIVILCIGLSLYPIAIRYMAGGQGSESYGSWQNWLVAALTLTVVIVCNNYGRGIIKLASVLIGIIVGYGVALGFGMVDFSAVGRAGIFALPKIMHFGIEFEVSSCVAIGLLFAINSLQAMGDVTATTMGGMDREATDKELRGGILGFGLSNIIGAFFWGTSQCDIQPECGDCHHHQGGEPLGRCSGSHYIGDCGNTAKVFRLSHQCSPVCAGRSYPDCVCRHHSDRNPHDIQYRPVGEKRLYRWYSGGSWSRGYPGIRRALRFSLLDDRGVCKNACGHSGSCFHSPEPAAAKG